MPIVWCVFFVKPCHYTHPPENKFVVIVCEDDHCMGFLFNSKISNFVKNRPELLKCQLSVKASEYHFLDHDSYIDCGQIYSFDFDDLLDGRAELNNQTKLAIKKLVATATTIPQRFIEIILAN